MSRRQLLNRLAGNRQTRRPCRWCEGIFRPKKSDTETTCSTKCAVASLTSRDLPAEKREELRQAAVAARRAQDAERGERLRANLARKAKA